MFNINASTDKLKLERKQTCLFRRENGGLDGSISSKIKILPFLEVGIVPVHVIALVRIHLTLDPSACACVCAMLTCDQAILLRFFFGRLPNFALLRKRKKEERLIAVWCSVCITLKVNIHNINSL